MKKAADVVVSGEDITHARGPCVVEELGEIEVDGVRRGRGIDPDNAAAVAFNRGEQEFGFARLGNDGQSAQPGLRITRVRVGVEAMPLGGRAVLPDPYLLADGGEQAASGFGKARYA